MITQNAITQRVKFLIKYIIDKGIASTQEEIGSMFGVKSKSQVSMLVNNKINNATFLNFLLTLVPEVNREWLYKEEIIEPFLKEKPQKVEKSFSSLEEKIKELETNIELLKKDVRYYADMADSRLQTIEVQSKLITALEGK
jgi:predicted XRE-type DNA-binding protein